MHAHMHTHTCESMDMAPMYRKVNITHTHTHEQDEMHFSLLEEMATYIKGTISQESEIIKMKMKIQK